MMLDVEQLFVNKSEEVTYIHICKYTKDSVDDQESVDTKLSGRIGALKKTVKIQA